MGIMNLSTSNRPYCVYLTHLVLIDEKNSFYFSNRNLNSEIDAPLSFVTFSSNSSVDGYDQAKYYLENIFDNEELNYLPEWNIDFHIVGNGEVVSRYLPIKVNNLQQFNGSQFLTLGHKLIDMLGLNLDATVYAVYEILVKISNQSNEFLAVFETRLLKNLSAYKINERVLCALKNPISLTRQQIFLIKALARLKEAPLLRLCMHKDCSDNIQEMLMVHSRPISIGAHRQNKDSLSYHILSGNLKIKLLNNSGDCYAEYNLTGSDASLGKGANSIRLPASEYRVIETTSDYSIFWEISCGPFEDSDTEWLYGRGN